MLDRNDPALRNDQRLDKVERGFDAIFSPITWLAIAGFVLGVWGTFEFGLPIYSAIIGLAVGAIFGGLVRIFSVFT